MANGRCKMEDGRCMENGKWMMEDAWDSPFPFAICHFTFQHPFPFTIFHFTFLTLLSSLFFIFTLMEPVLKRLGIKDLAEDDRPREKLATLGRQALSDAELIAIILRSGNNKETALQLAQRMLAENNNSINDLARLSVNELKKYRGVGETKAVTIVAAFELGQRKREQGQTKKARIQSSHSAYELLAPRLSDLRHEEFRMLLLDRSNQVMKDVFISSGGISGTVVDIRLLCKQAIDHGASGVILAHNHPSGQVRPSKEDKELTKRIREGLKLFDITLHDHIIVGDKTYFSFADEHLIE